MSEPHLFWSRVSLHESARMIFCKQPCPESGRVRAAGRLIPGRRDAPLNMTRGALLSVLLADGDRWVLTPSEAEAAKMRGQIRRERGHPRFGEYFRNRGRVTCRAFRQEMSARRAVSTPWILSAGAAEKLAERTVCHREIRCFTGQRRPTYLRVRVPRSTHRSRRGWSSSRLLTTARCPRVAAQLQPVCLQAFVFAAAIERERPSSASHHLNGHPIRWRLASR